MADRSYDVVVAGDANVDLLLKDVPPLEPGKEKLARGAEMTLGGSSSITALSLAGLGVRVAFVGVVGLWGILFFSLDLIRFVLRQGLLAQGLAPAAVSGKLGVWIGISLIMMNVGAFLGLSSFSYVTQRIGRRPAFVIAFVLAMLSAMLGFWFLGGFAALDGWTRGLGLGPIATGLVFIGAALDQLRARGARLIDNHPRTGAEGSLIAFVHPSSAHGVLVELKQAATVAGLQNVGPQRIARRALGDLEGIFDYTESRWGRDQASRYADALSSAIEGIGKEPERWRRRDDVHPGCRVCVCRPAAVTSCASAPTKCGSCGLWSRPLRFQRGPQTPYHRRKLPPASPVAHRSNRAGVTLERTLPRWCVRWMGGWTVWRSGWWR